MKKQFTYYLLCILCCFSSAGLAHDEGWNLGSGTTVGAVLGGVVGYQIDKHDGAVVGSILGAIAGSRHYHASHHRHALRYFNQLEEQRIRNRIRQRIETETQRFVFDGDNLFVAGTAKLSATASVELSAVVAALQRHPRTLVHISGYTDSEQQPYKNRVLSLGWAESVAGHLVVEGISRERMQTSGGQPVSAADGQGAQSTRRIEVLIEPVFSAADR